MHLSTTHNRARQLATDEGVVRHRLKLLAPNLLGGVGLFLLSLALYLPYALKSGWFLDDWTIYSEQKDSTGFIDGMTTCMNAIPGGRKLACVYHVTEWSLLGDHRWAYHLVSIGFLTVIAILAYAISRRAQLSRLWCLTIGAAIIVFPGADTTRLWPVASIGQYVIVLQMTSLLIAVVALNRPLSWRTTMLHTAAGFLAVLAMVTYEIAVPLVALQGLVYMAIFRNRRAFFRWMIDLGLVLMFVIYRLILAPVGDQALMVKRTFAQLVSRIGVLLKGTWHTWHSLYAPGPVLVGIAAIIGAAAIATAVSSPLRIRLARWWLLLVASVFSAGICALVFLTAEDLYVPQVFSTYNRVNLPGTIPYVLVFVAVLGLLYEMIRYWSPWAFAGPLAVLVVALGIAKHQFSVRTEHQDAWLNAWSAEARAIPGTRDALRGVPAGARILGFDTPQWEPGWIPVFAQTWDYRGMIDYETNVHPNYASPFREDVTCGRGGIKQAGSLVAPYRDRTQPVYFVSPTRGIAVHVMSRQQCTNKVETWGYAPYWDTSTTN